MNGRGTRLGGLPPQPKGISAELQRRLNERTVLAARKSRLDIYVISSSQTERLTGATRDASEQITRRLYI